MFFLVTKTNKNGEKLRSGYTTGTCAAAASRAALELLITNKYNQEVIVDLPKGGTITVPIKSITVNGNIATGEVIKDGGDDADVTHGISIYAQVELLPRDLNNATITNEEGVLILGGKGVGKVTKPGLATPVGNPAINPTPRKMIITEVKKVLPKDRLVQVTISAPAGEDLAKKTLNPRLGIVDGISILGTSGIVRPMSEEAYVDSLIPQIDQAIAFGHDLIVLTPGGMGEKMAMDLGIPKEAIVQMSNFVGDMLRASAKREIKGIILFGHIGKIIKVAGGIFHTHSKIADGRREILATHTALAGAPIEVIQEIMELNTIDASVELMKRHNLQDVYHSVAQWASKRSLEMLGEDIKIGTVMYALDGEIIAYDHEALELGRELGWQV